MRHKRLLLIIPLCILALAAVTVGCRPREATPTITETAEVKRGNLDVTVSAVGNLSIPHQALLSFGASGKVKEVSVSLGDAVKKGQALAKLDTTALEQSVVQAELAVQTAEVSLKKAQSPYTSADVEKAVAAATQAEAALRKAEQALTDTRTPDAVLVAMRQAAVDAADATLKKANDDLSALEAGASEVDLSRAEAAVTQARALLDKANDDLSKATTALAFILAEADVAVKQANLDVAQEALDKLKAGADATALARARATIAQAQAALDQAKKDLATAQNPDATTIAQRQADIDAARANLLKAKEAADLARGGADADDIAIKQLQLQSAQNNLKIARKQLEEATITAPFDGIIADANVRVDDVVNSGFDVVRLVDTSRFEVEVLVDELDIRQVSAGFQVELTLDALPALVVPALVKTVSPTATIQGGVVSYRVVLNLLLPEGRDVAGRLREGLTVTASIIAKRRNNVLLVPSRALTRGVGEWTVVVVKDGVSEERTVQIGDTAEGVTEITSGLTEGEKVALAPGRTALTPRPAGSPGGLVPRGVR